MVAGTGVEPVCRAYGALECAASLTRNVRNAPTTVTSAKQLEKLFDWLYSQPKVIRCSFGF